MPGVRPATLTVACLLATLDLPLVLAIEDGASMVMTASEKTESPLLILIEGGGIALDVAAASGDQKIRILVSSPKYGGRVLTPLSSGSTLTKGCQGRRSTSDDALQARKADGTSKDTPTV